MVTQAGRVYDSLNDSLRLLVESVTVAELVVAVLHQWTYGQVGLNNSRLCYRITVT